MRAVVTRRAGLRICFPVDEFREAGDMLFEKWAVNTRAALRDVRSGLPPMWVQLKHGLRKERGMSRSCSGRH